MKIERIKIENFKALRDVELHNIPDLAVFLGANGSGKSTFFSVFDFLQTAILMGVHKALDKHGGLRGFDEVRSRGSDGDIHIEIKFRTQGYNMPDPLLTYTMRIGKEDSGQIVVEREVLRSEDEEKNQHADILSFTRGKGSAYTQESLNRSTEGKKKIREVKWTPEDVTLKSPDTLAITSLAQFERFPYAVRMWDSVMNWHFSDIHIKQTRARQIISSADHLSSSGDNLYSVINRFHKDCPSILKEISEILQMRVPGIDKLETQEIQETGEILLKIKDKSFKKPFLSDRVSHGTIKMLAYLVMLYDPSPHEFLFVEEPENQLYHSFLQDLAEEFRAYASRNGTGRHVFVSTHSPDFLNAVEVDEVFLLVKEKGYTNIVPASSDEQIRAYMENGDKMGRLWAEGFLRGVSP